MKKLNLVVSVLALTFAVFLLAGCGDVSNGTSPDSVGTVLSVDMAGSWVGRIIEIDTASSTTGDIVEIGAPQTVAASLEYSSGGFVGKITSDKGLSAQISFTPIVYEQPNTEILLGYWLAEIVNPTAWGSEISALNGDKMVTKTAVASVPLMASAFAKSPSDPSTLQSVTFTATSAKYVNGVDVGDVTRTFRLSLRRP